MIPHTATKTIADLAKLDAASTAGGGVEKKLNDMQSYMTSAGMGAVSFALAHIPIVGPGIAKAFELASGVGIGKLYEKLLSDSADRKERIRNGLFLMETSLSAAARQAYNTMVVYQEKIGMVPEDDCEDCQEAFKAARGVHLAAVCIEEIEAAAQVIAKLAEDLAAEAMRLKAQSDIRVNNVQSRIENFRDNHPNKKCLGTRRCYFVPGAGTVFGSIGNDDL